MNFSTQKISQTNKLPRMLVVTLLHALLLAALLHSATLKKAVTPPTVFTLEPTFEPPPKSAVDPKIDTTALPKLPNITLPPIDTDVTHAITPPKQEAQADSAPSNSDKANYQKGGAGTDLAIRQAIHTNAIVNANACEKPAYPLSSLTKRRRRGGDLSHADRHRRSGSRSQAGKIQRLQGIGQSGPVRAESMPVQTGQHGRHCRKILDQDSVCLED